MLSSARVAARYQREIVAAFISDKWFKQKKAELATILKQSIANDAPDSWWWIVLNQVLPFFKGFAADFNEIVSLDIARDSVQARVDSARNYIEALADKLPREKSIDFKDSGDVLFFYALEANYKKMREQAKTIGDLFKYTWFIRQDVIDKLIQSTLRAGTPQEIASLTDGRQYSLKFRFLDRVKFDDKAVKALKRDKLDGFDPTKWVDRIYDILKANYSESALQEAGYFQEFSLNGIKVIVDDRTVDASDIKKYVRFLSEAHARLRNKGFEDAWYGNVFIQCKDCGGANPNTGGETGGWYEIGRDTVTIFSRPGSFIVELMVHELGHRYWFKSMSQTQRGKFETLVKTYTKPRPNMPASVQLYTNRDIKEFRAPLFDAKKHVESAIDRASKYKPETINPLSRKGVIRDGAHFLEDIEQAMTRKSLAGDLGPEVQALATKVRRTRDELNEHFQQFESVFDSDQLAKWVTKAGGLVNQIVREAGNYIGEATTAKNRKMIDENPGAREWLESLKQNPAPVPAVSDYGKSNIDEAFAEVFAHYVLGYDITQDQAESFRAVLKMAAIERVTRNFLATVSPKDMLRSFESYRGRILPLLRDESKTAELVALYSEMTEKVRPLAFALEGVSFQRPDEARKLKNLQGWLRTIERLTKPSSLEGEDRPQIAISVRLDYLEEALKSVARSGARIEDYTKIEKQIPHGTYTILNKHGFRPEEYAEPLRTLDEASKLVSSAGFGSVVYGEVVLESNKGGGYAGMYLHSGDYIKLNVASKYRFDAVYTLVHELGHRVWYKRLSDAQRDAYEDAYVGAAKPISLAQREAFWKALEDADFDPKRAKLALAKELQEVFLAYWQERSKVTLPPTIKGVAQNREMFYRGFVLPKTRYVILDTEQVSSVTDYGKTNVLEDFAEVFAHFCVGKPLSPDAALRFREATGKG